MSTIKYKAKRVNQCLWNKQYKYWYYPFAYFETECGKRFEYSEFNPLCFEKGDKYPDYFWIMKHINVHHSQEYKFEVFKIPFHQALTSFGTERLYRKSFSGSWYVYPIKVHSIRKGY